MVHDIAQYDKIEGRGLVAGYVLDRLPKEPDPGSISAEEPADPWGDVYSGHGGVGVSPALPLGHRAFTAADSQDSVRPRDPVLQAVREIV